MPEQPLAHIHLPHLRSNYALAKELNHQQDCFAVIKAGAYGHNPETLLEALPNADGFAVARFTEAQQLRQLGATQDIVVLSDALNDYNLGLCLALNLTPCIQNLAHLSKLSQQQELPQCIWIKLDTGMHRQGINLDALDQLSQLLSSLNDCKLVLMTHLACADEPEHPLNQLQIARFASALKQLARSVSFDAISVANSGALLNQLIPDMGYRHIARPGLMIYGVNPNSELSDQGLKMAMQLSARVLDYRLVKAGETVGYGGDKPLKQDTQVATLGIGYGDGFPRVCENAHVYLNGHLCPLIGRVSMDLICVDVSALNTIELGDCAEIWGENLAIADLAKHSHTISYELLTRLSPRVKRQLT